jgi:phage terminase small subunit
MNKSWQAFLEKQRSDDRAQQCDQADETNARMNTMADAMSKMAEAISALTSEFREHAADADARLSVMLTETQKRKVQERKKKVIA